jgi:excisionase family DNA binding protein
MPIRGQESPMPPPQESQCPRTAVHPLGTEIYTTAQVAQALHLSMRTILRAIKSGKLPARRTGKQFLITREAVQAYWDGLPLAAPVHTAPNA